MKRLKLALVAIYWGAFVNFSPFGFSCVLQLLHPVKYCQFKCALPCYLLWFIRYTVESKIMLVLDYVRKMELFSSFWSSTVQSSPFVFLSSLLDWRLNQFLWLLLNPIVFWGKTLSPGLDCGTDGTDPTEGRKFKLVWHRVRLCQTFDDDHVRDGLGLIIDHFISNQTLTA